MDKELQKIIGEAEPEATPSKEEGAEPKETKEPIEPSAEEKEAEKKATHLAGLNKAIEEAQGELKKVRDAKKKAASPQPDEEEIPKINMEDPSAKAWDRHIRDSVTPLNQELEKEKEEVRTFALREFLADKPNLSKDTAKLKAVISTYDRIKTASERTREGVLLDLDKAYAAENYQELLGANRERRAEDARTASFFSEPGISRGSTSYANPKEASPNLSEDDKAVLARWGMTPAEWAVQKKKYG